MGEVVYKVTLDKKDVQHAIIKEIKELTKEVRKLRHDTIRVNQTRPKCKIS